MFKYIACILLITNCFVLTGQSVVMQEKMHVNMQVSGKTLLFVLNELQSNYGIIFSYCPNKIDLDKKVSVHVRNEKLPVVMELICDQTRTRYKITGNQVLLQALPKAQKKEEIKLPEPVPDTLIREDIGDLEMIQKSDLQTIEGKGSKNSIRKPELDLQSILRDIDSESMEGKNQLTQVSVLPFMGTNTLQSHKKSNNFSFNILWGINGGVKGIEVGGIANTIIEDVSGFQLAGMLNTVGGTTEGVQISGMANINVGCTKATQFAGLINTNIDDTDGLQVSGIGNIVYGKFSGFQSAGIANFAATADRCFQFSGIANGTAAGVSGMQLSGVSNLADTVLFAQVAGLVNVANTVKGVQIGLVNLADTVEGASIGLLNIIKKGYNKVEVGIDESRHISLALRAGSYRFHNIFEVGVNGSRSIWSAGYGIGSRKVYSEKWAMNYDIIAHHVNENQFWEKRLNLLGQFRALADVPLGKKSRFYFGASLNVLCSKLKNEDAKLVGSFLPSYNFYDKNIRQVNVKVWTGAKIGCRF